MGDQLHAQHPQEERAGVLGADSEGVHADARQHGVNLTRFNLFFPEKRDFFLENAGQFKMGTGGTFTSTTVETDLFFSRRIGLSDTGQVIPILGGARLAGKTGRHNIGILDIQTDPAFNRPGDNFLVARYGADVLKRSRVGAIFINKDTLGGDAHNKWYGFVADPVRVSGSHDDGPQAAGGRARA